jgi:hypothetical protein
MLLHIHAGEENLYSSTEFGRLDLHYDSGGWAARCASSPATATSAAGGIIVLLELGRRASWSCDETPLVIGIGGR